MFKRDRYGDVGTRRRRATLTFRRGEVRPRCPVADCAVGQVDAVAGEGAKRLVVTKARTEVVREPLPAPDPAATGVDLQLGQGLAETIGTRAGDLPGAGPLQARPADESRKVTGTPRK